MSPAGAGLGGRQPQAVRSALNVLRAVADAGPGVTAKEISARLQLPPATTYRLLNLLVGEEYLVRLPDLTGFALGARFAGLVHAATVSHQAPQDDTDRPGTVPDPDAVPRTEARTASDAPPPSPSPTPPAIPGEPPACPYLNKEYA